ncbi:MAG: ClbS/DfsB family four-helix bundle protein [Dehalococcoidia bacterium]
MDAPRTAQDILDAIRRDRPVLEDAVTEMSAVPLDAVPRGGGWSVKDHMAHIAAWERMIVAHLTDGSDHEVAGMDAASFAAATLDEVNDSIYHLHHRDTLSQVREEFAAAHEAIVTLIESLPEDGFDRPYWDDDPTRRPVHDKIAGDTYLHYVEHAVWVRELLESRPQTP